MRLALLLTIAIASAGTLACSAPADDDATSSKSSPVINAGSLDGNNSGYVYLTWQGATGTLLRNNWVLTAKHTLQPADIGSPGNINMQMGSQVGHGVYAVVHPWLDVALIKTEQPFAMNGSTSGYYRSIYGGATFGLMGQSVYCYGYGAPYVGGPMTDKLGEATLTLIPSGNDNEVKALTNVYGQIMNWGDSGGSCLTQYGEIAGVTSHGHYDPTRGNVPVDTYFVAPSAFRDWVASNVW